jgi:hypothetical protein
MIFGAFLPPAARRKQKNPAHDDKISAKHRPFPKEGARLLRILSASLYRIKDLIFKILYHKIWLLSSFLAKVFKNTSVKA